MRAHPAILAFVVTARVLSAQPDQDLAAKADAYIKSAGIRGSILVAKGGKVILARGYGFANIELEVPNSPETKFRLGSITKQFTATAILQLQEKGKLKVTDEISTYVPGAPATWKGVTIHHLLTHTSGIPSYTNAVRYQARMRDPAGNPIDFLRQLARLMTKT